MNVLIVEDDDDSREVLCEFLAIHGCQIYGARNGIEAMALTKKIILDIALIDLQLPIMDGFQIAKAIRDAPSNHSFRLIAVTGSSDNKTCLLAKEAGFDEVIIKPIDFESILNMCRSS